jgi:hypothetical protein
MVCNELVLLPICVICNEWIFTAELCCLQRISIHCWNYIIRSEFMIRSQN